MPDPSRDAAPNLPPTAGAEALLLYVTASLVEAMRRIPGCPVGIGAALDQLSQAILLEAIRPDRHVRREPIILAADALFRASGTGRREG